jgi:hypothetical protein
MFFQIPAKAARLADVVDFRMEGSQMAFKNRKTGPRTTPVVTAA